MKPNNSLRISKTKLILTLYVSVSILYFYIDQYFHTHFASNYSYTRPYFRAFYLFDTWSYAILFSSFLIILSVIEKDRFRALYAVLILTCTCVFNITFIGVNSGYYFPWNLITTEPNHWLMQWGFNLIVNVQWMLFLMGILKDRGFALFLIPLGAVMIIISSLFRNELHRIFAIGAAPIEVAYGVTLFTLSAFTTAYLVYRKKKNFILALAQSVLENGHFAIISMVAFYAPLIHSVIPFFIFERDMGLVSVLFAVMAYFFMSKAIKEGYFEIDRKYLIAAVAIIVLSLPFLGGMQYQGRDNVVVEYIGGKYEARIRLVHFLDIEEFYYIKEGEGSSGYYTARFKASLDWIEKNSPENSVFLCWWDYGHMIRGVAEREVIIFAPSKEILWSIADPGGIQKYSDHQHVLNVARALTTTNPNETISVMSKYGATYIFVTRDDAAKAWVLLKIVEQDPDRFITSEGFTEEGKKTTLYKILHMIDVDGFKIAYNDADVVIYKLKL